MAEQNDAHSDNNSGQSSSPLALVLRQGREFGAAIALGIPKVRISLQAIPNVRYLLMSDDNDDRLSRRGSG